ncbi:FliI/YscN family ATPase [Blastopirellula marina]|uniref:EscN/YscN/HrcN family type III secretion system ATPase n=1 Tax=Blastopirellula marina TaxID=124 RepID=A0A2S8FDB1_9BACT|nr:FliI/YscN family ATPase [Blastopirellula marina]PQO29914.1 EscN/YscN/HrcN family type III secretion system ATPase [Blastopirellula marina]PTL42382.1 FliI/YscN family ATPase [Blastopirellula marina]
MIASLKSRLRQVMPTAVTGSVVETLGTTTAVAGFPVPIGAVVEIDCQLGSPIPAEVIGFRGEHTLVYPLTGVQGIRRGNQVRLRHSFRTVGVGKQLLGRVLDAHGHCCDQRPQPVSEDRLRLDRDPPSAVSRPRIDQTISTGVRAIDGMLTCGLGQRVGIFAGSGVGKSVTLGMMARYTSADVNVIALIGERGREVNDFIERDLGPEGMARSVVVVATSDQPAIQRMQAALAATSIAEYFRDQGKNVLFMMDSVTRFAMAQREIGLAAGEPPTTKGYPPSMFALLPRLVERTGRTPKGSITAFYTVLVEGDDTNEPVADTVRGLLDGHIVLSRKLAGKGHYPAIDVMQSISRLMNDLVSDEVRTGALVLRDLMSTYAENEDLINIGAYRQGSNPRIDMAIRLKDEIDRYLRQAVDEQANVETAHQQLLALVRKCSIAQPAAAAGKVPRIGAK